LLTDYFFPVTCVLFETIHILEHIIRERNTGCIRMVQSVAKEVSLYVCGNCNLPGNAVRNLNAIMLDGCGMCDARLQTKNQ